MFLAATSPTLAHDIPNARVDRSIQVTVSPGRLRVDYEISIGELTLTQELRQLVGELPDVDRAGWFAAYGRETGPLNAKGVIVTVDGEELDLKAVGFDLAIEGHPRYTFHLEASIPSRGHLRVNDTNFAASEGTSRLAIRPEGSLEIRGDSLPIEVAEISILPVWQLSNADERRTRQVTVDYRPASVETSPRLIPPQNRLPVTESSRLSRLLDNASNQAWPALLLAAMVLGAGHAIQPGHGKTLVASASLGVGSSPIRGAMLGLATATAHLSSVALIALVVWSTRASGLEQFHLWLTRGSGLVIASIGCWRLGRHLADLKELEPDSAESTVNPSSSRSLVTLAFAGGVVPCWDAVALVVLSQAIGRLGLGLVLLAGFSLGMAGVLVVVGVMAGRLRSSLAGSTRFAAWERRLGLVGGLILTFIGVSLLVGR